MVKIAEITQTCLACPSQWEGTTEEGEEIYVRYRWGTLRIDLNHRTVFQQELGDGLDGVIEWEDVVEVLEEL